LNALFEAMVKPGPNTTYGQGSLMAFQNIRLSSGVVGRPPQERMKASTSSSVIAGFAGLRYTGLNSTVLAALVRAEELEMRSVVFLEVKEAIFEYLSIS